MGSFTVNRPNDPATDRQVSYLDALSKEMVSLALRAVNEKRLQRLGPHADAAAEVVNTLAGYSERGDLTKGNASQAIDFIVDSNRKLKAALKANESSALVAPTMTVRRVFDKTDAGVYKNADGKVYRVYFGQQSGQMLCKEVVGTTKESADFIYRGLAERYVTGEKLPLDEAKAWGKATETCIACGRRLDVPESVDAGIGPVCAGKF